MTGRSRLEFVGELKAHWIVKVLALVWLLFGAVSTVITFSPSSWQRRVSIAQYVPRLPWYIWIMGVLALALIVLFDAAYNVYSCKSDKPNLAGETLPLNTLAASKDTPDRIHIEFKPHIEAHGSNQTTNKTTEDTVAHHQESKTTHNIQLIRAKSVYVQPGIATHGFYEKDHKTDFLALVACFRNEPIFGKHNIVGVKHVSGSVLYFDSRHQEISEGVAGICWLNDYHDCVDFEVGKQTHNAILLVLKLQNNTFFVPFLRRKQFGISYKLISDSCMFQKQIAYVILRLVAGNSLVLPPLTFDLQETKDGWELSNRPS